MIYNTKGKDAADNDAQKTVDYYLSIGVSARLSTTEEDKIKKFDMEVDGVKIDLKRINGLYCEIDKL